MSKPDFQRELETLLDKEFRRLSEHLLGMLSPEETNFTRGYLRGIREIGIMCRQIEKDIYGEKA